MIALTALKHVEPTRLAKAATALMEGEYIVTVSQCTEFYLSGSVRGREKTYHITLTTASAHCECEDSRFHHSHCKHVAMFALTLVRAMQDVEAPKPSSNDHTIYLIRHESTTVHVTVPWALRN